jgi:H+-transporting ATP synthase F0 complex subunit s
LCILFIIDRYDRKRVQEIGPDRACAEWLLRCSGSVRFKNWNSVTADYNAIPSGAPGQCKIEEIRAVKACITSDGFAYLGYLIRFIDISY